LPFDKIVGVAHCTLKYHRVPKQLAGSVHAQFGNTETRTVLLEGSIIVIVVVLLAFVPKHPESKIKLLPLKTRI
jgi:hypothetical protein